MDNKKGLGRGLGSLLGILDDEPQVVKKDATGKIEEIDGERVTDIDIRLIRDRLYIRFLSGDSFDSLMFNKKEEKKNLIRSLAVLEEIMKTMEKIKEIIDKKTID